MPKATCKDLCLRVLAENPVEHFDTLTMSRVLSVKHGHQFSTGTIRRALHALWKDHLCESLTGGAGSDTYVKELRDPTPEEREKQKAHHAAWQRWFRANLNHSVSPNLTGPPGLLPSDEYPEAR